MTDTERALYAIGYTDCRTVDGKTAALHQVPNGTVLRTELEIKGGIVTWGTQNTFYGSRQIESAKSALDAWERNQQVTVQLGFCG